MSEPNTAELVAIYRHIEAHPEEWVQACFAKKAECGTAYCVAGHAVARAGRKVLWEQGSQTGVPSLQGVMVSYDLDEPVDAGGFRPSIRDAAGNILGLDEDQADELFNGSNTLDVIRTLIRVITGVDPAVPTPLQRADELADLPADRLADRLADLAAAQLAADTDPDAPRNPGDGLGF